MAYYESGGSCDYKITINCTITSVLRMSAGGTSRASNSGSVSFTFYIIKGKIYANKEATTNFSYSSGEVDSGTHSDKWSYHAGASFRVNSIVAERL